ncbi:unnamed protein product [Closterium sp. NIES-53]
MSDAATAPPATADGATRSQWLSRDGAARLAIRNHLLLAECAHFGQHRTAQALYDAVVACYSSPATAALGRLLLTYLFPELSAFAKVEDLVSHLRASDARYCAALPVEFLAGNPPPMDHFLSLDPTSLTVDRLEHYLLATETSAVTVGAARGTPRPPFFEGCSPSSLAPSYASSAAADVSVAADVGAASASAKRRSGKGKGGKGGEGGGGGGGGGSGSSGGSSSGGGCQNIIAYAFLALLCLTGLMTSCSPPVCLWGFSYLYPTHFASSSFLFLHTSASGTLLGTAPAQALHSFMLDSGTSRCFFRDSTTLTPLPAPVPVRLADPSGGPVVARSSTVLPCPADAMVTTTTPGGQRVSICMCTWTGRHLATFTRRPGSSLYTLATEPPQVVASAQVSASGQGPARVSGQSRECYFFLAVDDYTRYTTVFPLRSKGQVVDVLIPWIRTVCLQLHERFGQDLPVLRRHSNRASEFSSNLLRDFCRGEGILQSFTLPASPQQNGIAERRIGLVMEVGEASVFRVWGSRAFVRDTSADKLSARAIPCVFLGFSPDTPGWQFYHPTSRRDLLSQDVTFDESVSFYRLFPYHSTPPPPPPLFLAPSPPPVDPLPPQGPAPSGVSQVDNLSGPAPVQVAVGSGAARGAALGGAASWGAEPRPGGAEPEGVEPGGAASEGAESGGVEPQGAALSGGSAGASPRLSPQQLREWFVWRTHLRSGASGAGGAGAAGPGGTGVAAGAGVTGGTATTGPGGARTRSTGAAGTGGVEGAGAGDLTESGATGAGGARAGGAGVGGTGAGGVVVGGPGGGGVGAEGAGAVDPGGAVRPRPYFVPLLQQVLGTPSCSKLTPPLLWPPPDLSQPPLQPASPLLAPSPYTKQSGGLTECHEPASRPVSPVRTALRVPRSRPPPVPSTHAMTLRPSTVPLHVPLPAPSESSLPEVPDPESDRTCAARPTVSRLLATAVTYPSFESTTASALVAELLDFAAACRLDHTTALIAESTSAGPPSVGGECALGTDVLEDRVKRPPGSPPAFKERYVARGFSQRQGVEYFQTFSPTPKMTTLRVLLHVVAQRDYELHSLDFSTAFPKDSLHKEIRLRRPPGFTESFPAGTQWSLRRPVYGLRQAPREWHDTLRTTLAALGFAPAIADLSLFLRTDTSLPPFYVLVYAEDLVLQHFGLQFSSPQPTPLSTSHSLSAPPSDESVEPSGLYPELVGCLIFSGIGLVLGGRGPIVLTGHVDASWVDDLATSNCEAEIYARAMASQELRWLTYLLIDLGEQPCSPPVLYVDNKAMIALCQEHRLEHRMKHIALRYFLARELQQRGQLLLAYVATRANTADVFIKALPPGDHQRFATVLGLVPTLPHLLTA